MAWEGERSPLQGLRHRDAIAPDALHYRTKTLMYLPLANGAGMMGVK
jgi:hypothetical protein